MIYKAARVNDKSVSYVSLSLNDGKSFIKARRLVESELTVGRGPVRTKPYLVRKGPYAGRVLFPSSVDNEEGFVFSDYSDDDVRTITQSNEITPADEQKERAEEVNIYTAHGVVQATLYEDLGVHHLEGDPVLTADELSNKYCTLHMIMSASGAQVYQADSHDGGATWGEPYGLPLVNCNAAIDVVTYMNRLICCGKLIATDSVEAAAKLGSEAASDCHKSAPLALYISKDGKTFSELLRLEDDPDGVYTSPYMQVDRRHHLLYISYTDHRKAIKIRIFRLMSAE